MNEFELNLSSFAALPEGDDDNSNNSNEAPEIITNESKLGKVAFEKLPDDLEEEEIEGEEEVIDNSNLSDDDEVDELYPAFAKELVQSELLDEENIKEVKSLDDIVSLMQAKFEKKLAEVKEAHLEATSSQFREFLKEKNNKGEIISSYEDFLNFKESDFEDNDELATKILAYYYSEIKGLESDVIKNIIDNEIDIESKAKKVYKEFKTEDDKTKLKLKEEFKAKELAQQKQMEEFESTLFSNTKKLDEFIPGYKVSESKAKELTGKIPDTLNRINQNLVEFAPKLVLLMEAGFFDGKFDSLIRKGATKQAKEFDAILSKKGVSMFNNKPTIRKDSNVNSWDK